MCPKAKLVEMSGMGAHVTQVHFIDDLSQWEKWYGSLEDHIEKKIYHQCALCDTPTFFLVDLIEIAKHMKKHLPTTPSEYIAKHFGTDSSLKIVKDTSFEKSAISPKVDEVKTSQLPITPKPVDKVIIPRSVTLKMVSPTSATSSAAVAQTPSKNRNIASNPMTPPFSPANVTPSVASFKSPVPPSSSVFMSPSNSPGTVTVKFGKYAKKEKIENLKISPVKRSNSDSDQTSRKNKKQKQLTFKEKIKAVLETSPVKRAKSTEEPISQDYDENKSVSLLEKVKKASKGEGSYTTEELLAAVDLCLSPI